MIRSQSVVVALACALSALDAPAAAQQVFGEPAIVATEAPVFLLPDATRTPLRRLPVGQALTLLDRKGEWLQVTFEDQQLGRRTAWIESRFVRIRPAGTTPPETAAPVPTPPPAPATGTRQSPPARQTRRPTPPASIGARAFGSFAVDWMAAGKSFEAVTGSDVVWSYGGGLQVTNVWRGLFLEGAVHHRAIDGERVFAFNDEVFPLGIPMTITMTPVDVVAGWRTAATRRTFGYLGGGLTFFRYQEVSDFSDDDENLDDWHRGFVVMGGIEMAVSRWVHVRGDLRYRQVRDVLGLGGVSSVFEEDRLGGFGVGVHVMVGR